MTPYELATLASTVAIGLGQIGIVWYGIRAMNRASDERAQDRRQQAQALDTLVRQSDASIRQLDASTTALRTLIERTGRAEPA